MQTGEVVEFALRVTWERIKQELLQIGDGFDDGGRKGRFGTDGGATLKDDADLAIAGIIKRLVGLNRDQRNGFQAKENILEHQG